jgi:hypothetical protein
MAVSISSPGFHPHDTDLPEDCRATGLTSFFPCSNPAATPDASLNESVSRLEWHLVMGYIRLQVDDDFHSPPLSSRNWSVGRRTMCAADGFYYWRVFLSLTKEPSTAVAL